MRNLKQETVDLLLKNGFEITGESNTAVSLSYKGRVKYHVGETNWSAYDIYSGEEFYGHNSQHSKLFLTIYKYME
jgi:hypothetical protein